MRINYLSCLASHCGIGRYTEELATAVHKQGQNVQLLRKNGGPQPFVQAYPHRSLRELRHLVAPWYLQKAIRKTDGDIWHADNIDAFSALQWSGRGQGQKKIVTIHDTIPLRFAPGRWWEQKAYHYHLKQAASRADLVVTVSETSREDLTEMAGIPAHKIKVVYNGLNHKMLYPQPGKKRQERLLIRYIGGLGAVHKNASALIETARVLKESKFDFRMEIGGGHAEATELPGLVARYGLQRQVTFAGFVPDKKLQQFLAGADVFLFPSLYEGFGFPPLEAMACGTAVVAANVASLAELLTTSALLTPPEPEAFAAAIIKLGTCESRRQQAITEGLRHSTLFRWDVTAKKMLAIYREEAGN